MYTGWPNHCDGDYLKSAETHLELLERYIRINDRDSPS
jgi:hypothetical protein